MNARRQSGMAMLEALIAALLLAIGLLGVIGLQARSYGALADAGLRAEATIAAEELLGVMSTDQANLADYELEADAEPGERLAAWVSQTRARIPDARIVVHIAAVSGTSRSQVDIAISWQRRASDRVNTHRVTSYLAGAT